MCVFYGSGGNFSNGVCVDLLASAGGRHHLSGGSQLADLSPQGPTSLLRKALDEGPWAAVGFNKVAGFIWACVAYSQLKCSQHSLCLTYFPLCYCIFTEAIEKSSRAWQEMWERIFVAFSFSVILRYLPNFTALVSKNTLVKQLLQYIKKYFGIIYNTHKALKLSMDVLLLLIFL